MSKNFLDTALDILERDPSWSLNIAVCFYCNGVIQDESSEDGFLQNYLMAIKRFREDDINTSHTVSLAMGLQKYGHVMAKCLTKLPNHLM